MGNPTENTVNDLLASFLRSKNISVTTQPSASVPKGRRQPDFEVLNGGVVYGEGEWNSKYINGFNQAIEFGDIPGAMGYFLIGYPDELKDKIKQQRLLTAEPAVLLGDVTYRGVFKLKGVPSSLFRGNLEEIPFWIKSSIEKRRLEEPDEFIKLMHDIVQNLTNFLPVKAKYPTLFEHIIATIPKEKGEKEVAKKAAAYLLLNQVVFYNILKKRGLEPIDIGTLKIPAELYTVYFKKVVDEIDYNAIFDFDVASIFPKKSLQFIKDMIRIVNEIQPEEFTRDLLGNIFHSLIPIEVRKPVAAYYTNPMAARLLARLAIYNHNTTVTDLACGSGTLLMASYDRKAELLNRPFTPKDHEQFIENDITGIDIMPFAAHLAVVQLALKNPIYLTDKVRIGIRDSTGLRPGNTIKILQRVLPRGQQVLTTFDDLEKSMVVEGAVSGKGSGQEFTLSKVDVVIMNPPFTRQEKIPHDLKLDLEQRFKEYNDFMHPQMGLRAYFILLADRFLKPNGRIAFVLPATTLRVGSMEPIRRMIASRYEIEYIITTDYRSAFSESTSLREILLIARKRKNQESNMGNPCVVSNLNVLPNSDNIQSIEKTLKGIRTGDTNLLHSELSASRIVEQQEFLRKTEDWSAFLPSEQTVNNLIEAYNELPYVCPLQDIVDPKRIKRCDYPSIMHVAWKRIAKTQQKGNILKKEHKGILAQSRVTGESIVIPKSAISNGLWSLSGIETMDISSKEDRIIIELFPNSAFYFGKDISDVFKKWKGKLDNFLSDFVIPRKVDFGATGTIHLAIRSTKPFVPSTSIWGFGKVGESGKLLALFINSTMGIALLFKRRIEIRGTWSQFSKDILLSLPVPDFWSFNSETKKTLLHIYDKVKNESFPSLLEQLKTSFEGRMIIDKAIFESLGLEKYEDENEIRKIHQALAIELEHLKDMMARD